MSYKGEDKWDVFGGDLSECAGSLKQLKEKITLHIESFAISKAVSPIKIDDYEIVNLRFSIKKKEK